MFKRVALILLVLPCCIFASEFKKHLEKDAGSLKYLETHEDNRRLGLFSAMFDMAGKREKPSGEIPKTMHFIWLGPKPFPSSSVKNVRGWIDQHPGWRVRFWTDLGIAAPDDRMEVRSLDLFPLDDLRELYHRSDNFGERSQILRYAILLSEGGAYIDHDAICLQPIDSLQDSHDFFCGMELLGPRVVSSSVNPSPHLLASTAQHPIFKSAKRWLINEWDQLESKFPGSDSAAIYNRVQNRAFAALSIGVKESYARAGRKDVVFPPDYFSFSSKKGALYAVHLHRGSWYKIEGSSAQRFFNEVSAIEWLGIASIAAIIASGVFMIRRRRLKVKIG